MEVQARDQKRKNSAHSDAAEFFFRTIHKVKAQDKTSVTSSWIQCQDSKIHGRGVYARIDIPAGTRVIQYTGEKISKEESLRREAARLEREARGEDACVYIFDLNKRYDLDGATSDNLARLINHSCEPNCRAEDIRGKIWIIALRDIPAQAELTFDYGFPYSEWRSHPCRCGAKRCVGFIVNKAQRWRVRKILRGRKSLKQS